MTTAVKVAYVPLTDALPLFVARELGLFFAAGLAVELLPLNSWAQMRDGLILGRVQAGHCLPGIPLAAQAGLLGPNADLACAFTLNHYGNAITLSKSLYQRLCDKAPLETTLPRHARQQFAQGRPMRFASVFPVSKHEFELRHWLRGLGLDPDRDVNLVVVPPPLVADALQLGQIDGFCVGEPWNSLAVALGQGHMVASSRSLGLPGTEKVLAARSDFMHSDAHLALLHALKLACDWLDEPENRAQALPWLINELGLDRDCLGPALMTPPQELEGQAVQPCIHFSGINRPDRWHARWIIGQIRNNLHAPAGSDVNRWAEKTFRSDIYDQLPDTTSSLPELKATDSVE